RQERSRAAVRHGVSVGEVFFRPANIADSRSPPRNGRSTLWQQSHGNGDHCVAAGTVSRTFVSCLLLAGLLSGCSPSDEEASYLARRALLTRQNAGIREMIVDAEKGQLIQNEEFLVGIDETVVADVIRAGLPI